MLAAVLVVAGTLQLTAATTAPAPAAQAADLSKFDPGRIIDDSLFFNGDSMTARQVQDFLNGKVRTCQSGYVCLKDFRSDTTNKPADAMCRGYTAARGESAADIIAKVGQSCGISQKVLLTTLQKEQGLVNHTWPSDWRYTIAMGQGCPDTADCDTAFYGFFNQVYGAARQFKRYANPPGTSNYFTWYAPGKTWNVRYHPNESCGSSPVYIANQATANLYYYTPYQPNRAALNAGYGEGDGCSAYGNRNFFSYYNDWFGSTRGIEIGSVFLSYAEANRAWLGQPTAAMACDASGCTQQFSGGIAASADRSTVFGIRNEYTGAWSNYGRQTGMLGYPTSEKICGDMTNACRQEFRGGWIVGAPSGVRVISNEVRAAWANWGREQGAIGMPIADAGCEPGFCVQAFDNAWILTAQSVGTRVLPNAVWKTWTDWGRHTGTLGLPVGDPSVPGGSDYVQSFQGGTITVVKNVATVTSTTDPWFNARVTSPWLGEPTGSQSCTLGSGGCYQPFQNGWIVKSSAGSFAIPTVIRAEWGNWGREYGILGFPSGAPSASPTSGNFTQAFQGGVLTVANGVAKLTSTSDPWFSAIVSSPWLGTATGTRTCSLGGGGCYQPYQNGWVVQSSAGAAAVPNAVRAEWGNWGREYGILGFPTGAPSANPTSGNYTQAFQGGVITVSNNTARLTSTTDPWFATILASPWLGASTGSQSCTLGNGGCYQTFQNGWMVKSSAGAFAVPNVVRAEWANWGREYGILGFPSGAPSADPTSGNYTQKFQGGVLTVTSNVAKLTSTTDPWFTAVLANPWLGNSTGSQTCNLANGGCFQPFEGGWMVKSAAGSFAVPNAVRDFWVANGRETGKLGYPTGATSANPTTGNYTQRFQGGVVTVSNGVARL